MKMPAVIFGVLLLTGIAARTELLTLSSIVPGSRPLARLVTYRQARELQSFYSSLADVTENTSVIKSTSDFRRCQKLAVDILQATVNGMSNISAVNKPIEKILVSALGEDGEVPDKVLTAQDRKNLVSALEYISGQF